MSFQLAPLPYAYDALEPHIDARTMEIHYTKHHQGYTDKLNTAIEGTAREEKSIEEILSNPDALPADKKQAIINNGGGYYNHMLFWPSMSPNGGGEPDGGLAAAISEQWGSFEAFQEDFNKQALSLFGSGWTYLCKDTNDKLSIQNYHFQNTPLQDGLTPLLGLDVWEHAYYLKYQNLRPEYVKAWWQVINWDAVSKRFTA